MQAQSKSDIKFSNAIKEADKYTKRPNKLFHKAQWEIYIDPARRKVLCCGRRFGKTRLAIYECLRQVQIPNSKCWIVAPTYKDVNEIYVDDMIQIMENELKWKLNEDFSYSKGLFKFKNGSKIWLKSSDNQENLRGRGIDIIILDEFAIFLYKDKFRSVYIPALNPGGKLIIISTPKGYDIFYDLYINGQKDETGLWKSWRFTSYENTKLPGLIDEIELNKRDMTKQEYEQEYLAMFNSSSRRASPEFDRSIHVSDKLPIIFPEKQIRLGIDFNVDPMSWAIFQIIPRDMLQSNPEFAKMKLQNEVVCYIKEFKVNNINTIGMIKVLKQWLEEIEYKNRPITFYGDATGLYRDTSQKIDENSGKFITDWDEIKMAFPNSYYEYDTNPSHKNRINATNKKIKNAEDEIGILISNRCENIIRDFEQAVQKQGSFSLDKSSYDPHFYDACTYPLYQLYSPDRTTSVWVYV